MNFVRPANSGRRRFRESEIFHFAGFHQISHRAYGVFDRSVGVHAMLVIKIDVIDAEALERSFTGRFHVLRLAADAEERWIVLLSQEGELCGHEEFAAAAANSLAYQLLIIANAIGVGGVQEIDA